LQFYENILKAFLDQDISIAGVILNIGSGTPVGNRRRKICYGCGQSQDNIVDKKVLIIAI
jgi:hypothetical protein